MLNVLLYMYNCIFCIMLPFYKLLSVQRRGNLNTITKRRNWSATHMACMSFILGYPCRLSVQTTQQLKHRIDFQNSIFLCLRRAGSSKTGSPGAVLAWIPSTALREASGPPAQPTQPSAQVPFIIRRYRLVQFLTLRYRTAHHQTQVQKCK